MKRSLHRISVLEACVLEPKESSAPRLKYPFVLTLQAQVGWFPKFKRTIWLRSDINSDKKPNWWYIIGDGQRIDDVYSNVKSHELTKLWIDKLNYFRLQDKARTRGREIESERHVVCNVKRDML